MKDILYPAEDVEYMHFVYEILAHAASHYTNDHAYVQKGIDGQEEAITFGELKENVDALYTSILAKHLSRQHMAVIGETSIEWVTVYLALISGAGVCVPIDKELSDETMARQLNFADVETVFVSANYIDKLSGVLGSCPDIKNIVIMRGKNGDSLNFKGQVLSLADMIEQGKSLKGEGPHPDPAAMDPEKNCVIIFTSGTTGANKGVMLNNRSIMGTLRGCARLLHYPRTSFSVLPINHTYELNAHLMSSLYCGTCVYINDDLRRILKNLKQYQPEMSCMVPMMLDLIVRQLKNGIAKSGKQEKFEKGVRLSNFLRKFGIDRRKKLFSEILEPLGGRLQFIICGGAALNQDTIDFLDSVGVQIYNGYGITECSPVAAVNSSHLTKRNSVGRVLPTVKARIVDPDENGNGEIEFKGDIVMQGYYKAPEDNAKVFTEDRWFKTGDLGHLDEDEFLYISGRLKNLIVLPNGENVSPEELEERILKRMPYVKECVVSGNKKNNGLIAYIFPDLDYFKEKKLQTAEEILAYIQPDINAFNETLPAYKRIVETEIRMQEFEKNTTHKILRHKI